MTAIELNNIQVRLQQKQVLNGIDLVIEQGDFITFLGPSGCGKTTLLRTIAGLQRADAGSIRIGGREVANGERAYHMEPSKRGLGLVFQSYALWPHMTVFENVAFGLQVRRMSKADIKRSVQAALENMRIPELAGRYPGELSGGQQQRVAIARAIVTQPEILLLDEPLSNLDAKLRVEMRAELKRLHQELHTTIIYVTHDQQEALSLSTRVAVFFGGRIVQTDKPRQLYKHPATLQVADFIGNSGLYMNRLDGVIAHHGGRASLKTSVTAIPLEGCGPEANDKKVVVTIKPEEIRLFEQQGPGLFPVTVEAIFPSGSETLVQLRAGAAAMAARVMGDADYEPGTALYADLRKEHMNIYDERTGARLEKLIPQSNLSEESHHENRLTLSR
ncbi:ABC transporter ATP-binding protein [Paenibacillus sacheonensis]|uniref:ATP-binding cassette domain-containing protein n=1 Tax=Paenibacillus sacheonensis TaxID=742054 RepID=A0A7X5C333_9BACL|nr:ABC transporter ATP-binding protein [Paenibacillus sacheonensis]MBM7567086.1 multiple sugar transport system ATP-binding protein [Paenibacillus sacheonensis]NBC70984.1 ATP-binding cassette domain-containing protein [Paenibacillus sacheonensis]